MLEEATIPSPLVTGHGKTRRIKCNYCNEIVARSIVPHLRQSHPAKWESMRKDFMRLYNEGLSPRLIMKEFGTLLSWTVIEREILRLAEETSTPLVAHGRTKVTTWDPQNFKLQDTTLWRFDRRGNWAVHSSRYRGNWAPQVPRNLVLQYTKKGDWVLDPFVGGGTTIIECMLLGRNSVGTDISPHAVATTKKRILELRKSSDATLHPLPEVITEVMKGDATRLSSLEAIKTKRFNMICTHPPYANALRYTESVEGDLSHIRDITKFCDEMEKAAHEFLAILEQDGTCAIMVGDLRRQGGIVPLGFSVMERFKKVGFVLEEIIIKEQKQDQSTGFYWRKAKSLRFRIAHEYVFVFRKPADTPTD